MIATLALLCLVPQDETLAVRERIKNVGRVEFAYEGEFEMLRKPKPHSTPNHSFTGRFQFDASSLNVFVEHHSPQKEDLLVSQASFTKQRGAFSAGNKNERAPSSQRKVIGGYASTWLTSDHALVRWFPTCSLALINQVERKEFVDLGDDAKDGRRCRVVARRLEDIDEAKYWVDLERNGIVIASEFRRNGVLVQTLKTTDVTLQKSKKGRGVYLPMVAITELRADYNRAKKAFVASPGGPWCRWTTRIVAETLKIDDDAAKPQEVKFLKVPTFDETKPIPPIAKNAPPQAKPGRVDQKELVKTITDADIQKAQLQATLRPPPVDWTQRIAWGLVAIGILGAGFAWYRNVRAAG